jgi:hypothetical protein
MKHKTPTLQEVAVYSSELPKYYTATLSRTRHENTKSNSISSLICWRVYSLYALMLFLSREITVHDFTFMFTELIPLLVYRAILAVLQLTSRNVHLKSNLLQGEKLSSLSVLSTVSQLH